MFVERKARLANAAFNGLTAIGCLALLLHGLVLIVPIHAAVFWGYAVLAVLAYLAAGVFYMIWFYDTYRRVYLDSAVQLRYPPLWTWLGFSVPVFNLFLPYVLAANLWRQLNKQNPPPRYFKFWWLSHLLVFFVVPALYVMSWFVLNAGDRAVVHWALGVCALLLVCNSARLAKRQVTEVTERYTVRYPD